MRRFSLLSGALAVALVCLVASPVFAQGNVTTGGNENVTLKGFISATFYTQNQDFGFGNGQNAEWATAPEFGTDRWFLGGDVRNTRLTMAFNGPKVNDDLQLGGVIEADFFGGFNGTGAFSDEQPTPRLRLAYLDVHKGRTVFRMGQAWSPLFGNVPVSLSHIAFPLGYGAAGFVGWRFPGLYIYQPLSADGAAVQTKLTLGFMEGSWSGPGSNLVDHSAGEASDLPQFEARFDFSGKTGGGAWSAYVVGHYDQKDLSGVNAKAGSNDSLDGTAFEFGAKVTSGPVMVQGNVYSGQAIGQQFGAITQFGDISSWGAWIQGGYNFTKQWKGYLFYGTENPDDGDVLAAGGTRLENTLVSAEVIYDLGPYGMGFEWTQAKTKYPGGNEVSGDQLAISAIYRF